MCLMTAKILCILLDLVCLISNEAVVCKSPQLVTLRNCFKISHTIATYSSPLSVMIDIQKLIDEHKINNIEELQALLERERQKQNAAPVSDFLGLSRDQMYVLFHDPFSENSPLGFRDCSDTDLDKIPFLRVCERILQCTVLRQTPFKLTTSTASLPVNTVREVYQGGFIKEEMLESGFHKLNKESNATSLHVAKITLELAGVVRKAKNNWHLTKKGAQLVRPEQRNALFQEIFKAFTQSYNWAYLDGYYHLDEQLARAGFGFSMAMFAHFGGEARSHQFYAERYMKAFPAFLTHTTGQTREPIALNDFLNCYAIRTFERFAYWFGLMERISEDNFWSLEGSTSKKTEILERAFRLPALS